MKAAFLAAAVLITAGAAFYFGTAVYAAQAGAPISAAHGSPAPRSAAQRSAAQNTLAKSLSLSLPMFFEPNQGQTAPQVKFLARGAGYGLFLTADEAVLKLQKAVPSSRTATPIPAPEPASVIRMRLVGANASARVSGTSPLPGKSNYFIGNDRSQWRSGIPQFARVQYQAVYPGVDLVYYGNQGQLEYDFRVAPGARPDQIVLSFTGASAHIVSGDVSGDSPDSGDLVLSTANGDVRFHAPHVYQAAAPGSASSGAETIVAGSFRQLADNKIGFTIGDYDHSRELVIDPVLSYSTYLGGGGESLVKIAIDPADNIYLAGSTTSAYFFPPPLNGQSPPLQNTLGGAGAQNLFIAVINPTPSEAGGPQLLYATYLGGSGTDSLAGIAVDQSDNIYVAGSTTSPNFPTTPNAFQQEPQTGTHGFLSAITLGLNSYYSLTYSTYLAGNGVDKVTGLAIDNSCLSQSSVAACNAYVTGVTTSTSPLSNGFPANANAYQIQSNAPIPGQAYPGNPQFFASKIYTSGSGSTSMLYSTYFGGGNFAGEPQANQGGGIAVDLSSSDVNMYFTGTTNMLGVASASGAAAFPLYNAQQSCLNQASATTNCNNPGTATDAFVAKIDPNEAGSLPVYSTYLGGSGNDYSYAIAVDSASDAYVVGATSSSDWSCSGCLSGFQSAQIVNGATNGFIAKIGPISGSEYPLIYFTWLGGNGPDSIQDIKVDSLSAAHVVGTTSSTNFPVTQYAFQPTYGGGESDAFVALISTTLSGTFPNSTPPGDFSSYLGGGGTDQGTGVAIDVFGATYAAGVTQSSNFPLAGTPFQGQLVGAQNAFVSKIGASSILNLAYPNTSPAPNPVAAGNQVQFTFNIVNTGPDNANQVIFTAMGLPTTGLTKQPTAQVSQNTGSCGSMEAPTGAAFGTISCYFSTLPVNGTAQVEVDLTPAIPVLQPSLTVSGNVSANGSAVLVYSIVQPKVNVVDFNVTPTVLTPTVDAGDTAKIQVAFCSTTNQGYFATITPSQTTSPSMVTATTPTFTPTTVALAGTNCGTTTLSIATVARPVNNGGLLRRGPLYATWIPIAGLSLAGLGIAAGRKRRRWLVGAVLCLLAGILLLLPSCGSASSATPIATGTAAGQYTITIEGSAGTGASHSTGVYLLVR